MSEEGQLSKPKVNKLGQKELDKAEKQFEHFDQSIKEMTMDRLNMTPRSEEDQQTRLSSREISKTKDIYLKPKKSLSPGINPKTGEKEKFNEKFRDEYNFKMEYVQFIAENKEIIGESIELWTKPFGGMDCEFWEVPTNKPVWGPRHLAEKIKSKFYHRLIMVNNQTNVDGMGQYYGQLAADTTIQRLDAYPVSTRKSIFMGENNF